MGNKVLVDTSAFYALISSTDEFHQRAAATYANLVDQRVSLYTTSYVLVECMALIHRRLGFSILETFINSVRDTVNIIWIDGSSHWAGWDLIKSREGRSLSFVDCTTLLLGKSLGARLFAFDQDFVGEGLEIL